MLYNCLNNCNYPFRRKSLQFLLYSLRYKYNRTKEHYVCSEFRTTFCLRT